MATWEDEQATWKALGWLSMIYRQPPFHEEDALQFVGTLLDTHADIQIMRREIPEPAIIVWYKMPHQASTQEGGE